MLDLPLPVSGQGSMARRILGDGRGDDTKAEESVTIRAFALIYIYQALQLMELFIVIEVPIRTFI